METKFKSLLDVITFFSDEKVCREYLESLRWVDGKIVCQHCGSDKKIYKINDGKIYKCSACRKQFTVKMGTIFEDSPLPLKIWFVAIYLASNRKKGISSVQLAKDLSVTQDTAWFMLHRIRYAFTTKSFNKPLEGIVEADETYWGGIEGNKHADKKGYRTTGRSRTKTPIAGLFERDTKTVIVHPIKNTKSANLHPFIYHYVARQATLSTDEWRGYNNLTVDFNHYRVNHGFGQYVSGEYHTNNLENFWSHLKRGLHGTYISISKKHTNAYCQEFAYRRNTMKLKDNERFTNALSNIGGRLTYKELIK